VVELEDETSLDEVSLVEEASLVEEVSPVEEVLLLLEEALANSLRYSKVKERE
jgi:hypothetical protein